MSGLAYKFIEKAFKAGESMNDVIASLREENISDEVIKECINKYLESFHQENKEDVLADKNTKFEDWYPGPMEAKSSHWSKLQSILQVQKGWSPEMIKSLSIGSNAVVSRLANPKVDLSENENHQIKGLVLGYVQSGKTANYSAVITKALDAGYKFIIVLAGIHNNLRYQTEVRLRKEIVEPSELKADPITRMDEKGDFSEKLTQSANRVLGSKEGFGIAVLKKNASVLRKFNSWLEKAKPELLKNTPVLIIDDESDQASINTSKKPEENQTAINKQIRKCISNFPVLSYVGYTATPFANILIDTQIEDDLFPKDFIVALKKPISYIGAEELFGALDSDGNYKSGLPLIRTIDKMDEALISASKRNEEKEYDELPPSLEHALDYFIVAGAIRLSRGQKDDHISMLVHGSYLTKDQEKVHELIEDHIGLRKSQHNRKVQEALDIFEDIRLNEFAETTKQMGVAPDDLSESDFHRNIKFFLESFQIILDNSASDNRLSFEEKFWGIVVGGNTLSRGLTIEGLTVSYFIRSSKMYDSLMQMGRWFGYRPGYLDLKRIFITNELRDKFFEMATIENEIRDEIGVMAENKDRPLDLRIRVRQHPGMTVTARNKMRTAIAVEYSFSGRRVQPRYISIEQKVLKKNKEAVFELLEHIDKQGIKKGLSGFPNFRTSLLYENVPTETINQFLDHYKISNANKRMTNNFIHNYISKNESFESINVGILSQISNGDKYNFPNGEEIILLNRTHNIEVTSDQDPHAIYVRGLAVPRDEMIDMAEFIPNRPQNVDDVVEIDGERRGFSYIRSNYRPKNKPLLLIYPINQNSVSKDYPKGALEIAPIKATEIVFGIMMVFPEEEVLTTGRYIVNSTV
jgi:hypothetical protein